MDRNSRTRALIAVLTACVVASLIPGVAHAAKRPPKPKVTIDDVTASEGNTGTTVFSFRVTMSAAAGTTARVKYVTQNGTALAGEDFTTAVGSLAFAPGETQKVVNVSVKGDEGVEPDETFFVNLSGGGRVVSIGDTQGAGTITNDDQGPAISISDPQPMEEGNTGTRSVRFDVTLSHTSTTPVTVNYTTLDATATADDYTAASGTLTFAAGDTSEPIAVAVNGDRLDEDDETFDISLSLNSDNAFIADGEGKGTILDDDPLPALSVNDVVVTEPGSGANTAVFTVSLSAVSSKDVTVQFETADGSALAGADYVASLGVARILAGQRTAEVSVPLVVDGQDEPDDETFTLNLSTPGNAILGSKVSGTATIMDDDPTPGVVIGDVVVEEGNEGQSDIVFPVSLTAAAASQVTVDYATGGGKATPGSDYVEVTGTITFAPGQRTANVTVPVAGDALDEDDEDFGVSLSNVTGGANVIDGQATGSIVDDDAEPVMSINDVEVTEGGMATLEVSLSAPSGLPVTAEYATNSDSATTDDYEAMVGTVTFNPEDTTSEVAVQVKGDSIDEQLEMLYVDLSSPSHATIDKGRGSVTVLDDDKTPTKAVLKVRKTSRRIIARGRLEPPRPGQKMIVKLFKKRAGKWVRVRTKRPVLSAAKDANRDGVMESAYKARFAKPRRGRYCKIVARYRGDANYKAAKRTKFFRCR